MKTNKSDAFTLIEVLIGITLITVVMTAVTGLILNTLLSNQRHLNTLQALGYAQEGIEVMRFMRDSNWLQNYTWDEGSDLWGADFNLDSGDPLTLYLKPEELVPYWGFSNSEEEIETRDGFIFTRKLTVQSIADENDSTGATAREETVEVIVTVEWTDRIVERSVELSTYLTDWR